MVSASAQASSSFWFGINTVCPASLFFKGLDSFLLLLTLGTHGTLVSIKTTTQNYPLHLKHPGAKMVLLPPAVSSSIILIKAFMFRDFPMVQQLSLCAPNAGGLGLIPGQGTRSHMPQLKNQHVTTKIQHSLINRNKYFKKAFMFSYTHSKNKTV